MSPLLDRPVVTDPQKVDTLAELLPRYRAVICDLWGVLHNGRDAYPQAVAALQAARVVEVPVLLLSNVPKPVAWVRDHLRGLGVPDDCYDAVLSSGELTRRALAAQPPGTAIRLLGWQSDEVLVEGLSLTLTKQIAEARLLVACGLETGWESDVAAHRPLLSQAVAQGLTLLVANADRWVPTAHGLQACAGLLGDLYAELGGRVEQFGKPHAPAYAAAIAELSRIAGKRLSANDILAIGDGLPTDIAGACAQGMDSLFIEQGLHADDIASSPGFYAQLDTTPTYRMACLR